MPKPPVPRLLEGRPLDVLLEALGRFAPSQTLAILGPIARALDAAHAAKIIHRDLKPDNVIISHDDEGHVLPKLLDFGIAKLLDAGTSGPQTNTGAPIGTPVYMSPEQCRGTKVDHRSDVYSLGVMAFEMLTGTRPFGGETAMDVLVGHMQRTPPAPSTVWTGLNPAFDGPVLRMLAKNPDERPASPTAAIGELEEAARSVGIEADAAPFARDAIASVPSLRARQEASTIDVGTPVDAVKSVDAGAPTEAAVEPVGSTSGTLEPASALTGAGASAAEAPKGGARRGRNLVVGVAAVGLVAMAAFLGMRQGPQPSVDEGASGSKSAAALTSGDESAAAASAVASASSEGPESVVATAPPIVEPATVAITVHTKPVGAEVLLGDQRLGAAPGPFEPAHGREAAAHGSLSRLSPCRGRDHPDGRGRAQRAAEAGRGETATGRGFAA